MPRISFGKAVPKFRDGLVMRGVGRAFGTCGELVQGQFASGEDFLVTLPVDLWSEVQVAVSMFSSTIVGNLPRKTKTRMAIRKALDYLNFSDWGAAFCVKSNLPEGKGMASSSADIVAACRAVAAALNRPLSAEEISRIAVEIEPTDGVMYSDVVCYNHRQGRLLEVIGEMPPTRLLVLDLGKQVDTVAFNRIPKSYTADEYRWIEQAYEWVKAGIRTHDLLKIGLGATLSAEVNQRILPKPYFEEIVWLAREYGASGVCASHSGTVLGLLFARHEIHKIAAARRSILEDIDRRIKMFELPVL